MIDIFNRKLNVCRIILKCVEYGPQRWTELSKSVFEKSLTPWQVQWGLKWLCKNGYLDNRERGLYRITERGVYMLSLLMSRI